MQEYPHNVNSNSNNDKKLEKVITGKVVTKKKSGVKKFTDAFFADDIAKIKSDIISNVIIPNAKAALSDALKNSIDIIFGGATTDRFRKSTYTSIGLRDYNGISKNQTRTVKVRDAYNFDDIVLETLGDAELVLSSLDDLIDGYGIATVADLNELIGRSGNYTDCKYGWTNLSSARPIRIQGGYLLSIPKPKPIDK